MSYAEEAIEILNNAVRPRLREMPDPVERWRLLRALESLIQAETRNYTAPIMETARGT